MTRFGRWFAGTLLLVLALFVIGLLLPGDRLAHPAGPRVPQRAKPATAIIDRAELSPSGLMIPVVGIHGTDLVDTFGDPRGSEGVRGHGALDIMAPRGTPVVAAAAGTIEKIFESELGGHTIYVRSADTRFIYYYAHLDTFAPGAREGVTVSRGQRLGTVGSTGDADPAAPHLHLEIKRMAPAEVWHEGTGINPYPLLAAGAPGV